MPSVSFPSSRLHGAARRAALLLGGAVLALGLGACVVPYPYVGVSDQLQPSDLATIAGTTQEVLEHNKVGQSTNWTNPTDGHLGTVTPTSTFAEQNGTSCRNFQQTATIGGRTAVAYDTACRGADGRWKSVNYGSLSQAIRYADTAAYPAYSSAYPAYPADPVYPYYGGYPSVYLDGGGYFGYCHGCGYGHWHGGHRGYW